MKEMARKILTGKCIICGRKVFAGHSCYCWRCFEFSRHMDQRGLHADAVKAIWKYVKKYGYVCYYTGLKLEMKDFKSPWYFVFDHRIPGDEKTMVLTFALLNEMKSDMTDTEFKYNVRQLNKCFTTGGKFIKRRLRHWLRLRPLMTLMRSTPTAEDLIRVFKALPAQERTAFLNFIKG